MAKDPAFLFYSNDFLTGVADLTFEERGQYITLLALQHQKGHLTPKAIKISVPSVSNDVLSKFSIDEDGNYFNERLELEANKRAEHSRKQKERALKGWEKRKRQSGGEATADATALPLEDENVNEDTDVIIIDNSVPFSEFWNLYDKKEGRAVVERKWKQIKPDEQQRIIDHVPKYIGATPDKKFRKLPITYLNQKTWLDEDLPTQSVNGVVIKPETKEDREAREFMENLKKESINQILYPDVQSNFNDNQPTDVSRVQRISDRPAGDGVDKVD